MNKDNIVRIMTKTSVAIVKGCKLPKMVEDVLKLIGASELIKPQDKLLIKPNYVSAKHPSTGITTDSHVIESLINYVKKFGVNEIVVGEGGAGDTEMAFNVVGIRDVAARQQVKLVNLNEESRIQVRIPHALALLEVGIAETALGSTCIVNVPKLKVHHQALVTLCMKNLMGLILPKNIMHSQINEKIVDLASLFKDKVKVNIVDGLVGAEADEVGGNPVEMNLLIAGQDMVAVDSVATKVMGIDPSKVKYLRLAEERGLGVADLNEIEVLGETIEGVTRKFQLPQEFTQ